MKLILLIISMIILLVPLYLLSKSSPEKSLQETKDCITPYRKTLLANNKKLQSAYKERLNMCGKQFKDCSKQSGNDRENQACEAALEACHKKATKVFRELAGKLVSEYQKHMKECLPINFPVVFGKECFSNCKKNRDQCLEAIKADTKRFFCQKKWSDCSHVFKQQRAVHDSAIKQCKADKKICRADVRKKYRGKKNLQEKSAQCHTTYKECYNKEKKARDIINTKIQNCREKYLACRTREHNYKDSINKEQTACRATYSKCELVCKLNMSIVFPQEEDEKESLQN